MNDLRIWTDLGVILFTLLSQQVVYSSIWMNDVPYGLISHDQKLYTLGQVFLNSPDRSAFAVARLHLDGTLDSTFGQGGKTVLCPTVFCSRGSIAVQNDGKIVIAGWSGKNSIDLQATLVRLDQTGKVDPTFGDQGWIFQSISKRDSVNSLLILPDQKILATGRTPDSIFLERFLPNGELDSSFGEKGMVFGSFFQGWSSSPVSMVLQKDGKTVLAVDLSRRGQDGHLDWSFAIIRYDQNGQLDTAFNETGFVVGDFSNRRSTPGNILILNSGKILLTGLKGFYSDGRIAMKRFNEDGSTDVGFGNQGLVIVSDGYASVPNNTILTSDDRVVVGGSFRIDAGWSYGIASYHLDGRKDNQFGVNGFVAMNLGGNYDYAFDLTTDLAGNLYECGVHYIGPNKDRVFGIMKFTSKGSFQPDFGSGGITDLDFRSGENTFALQRGTPLGIGQKTL